MSNYAIKFLGICWCCVAKFYFFPQSLESLICIYENNFSKGWRKMRKTQKILPSLYIYMYIYVYIYKDLKKNVVRKNPGE